MTTKLTLTVEKDVIEMAKAYASNKGRSLSDLVESYLRTLTSGGHGGDELSPEVRKLLGSVKFPRNFDYKKELQKAINEKQHR